MNNILKSNNYLLEQRINTLETELQADINKPTTDAVTNRAPEHSQHQIIESLFQEHMERENRKQNFIFFNCPESATNVTKIATTLANECLADQGIQIRETDKHSDWAEEFQAKIDLLEWFAILVR